MQTAETTLTITSEELSVLRKALREFATKHDTGPVEEELADNIIYKLRNCASTEEAKFGLATVTSVDL